MQRLLTIHNLALQGIRPLDGYASSLKAWFPDLNYELRTVQDPEYHDCMDPMAVEVRLVGILNGCENAVMPSIGGLKDTVYEGETGVATRLHFCAGFLQKLQQQPASGLLQSSSFIITTATYES